MGGDGLGAFKTDFGHTLLEELAIFTFTDGFDLSSNELHPVFGEGSRLMQSHCGIESGLSSECREEGVGLFLSHNHFHHGRSNGFNVGAVGKLRIGHDRRWVAIHEDDLVALFAQGFASLDPRVVEFARLADDDGTGTDDENRF